MAALVAVGGAVSILFGERIGINAGQGWDGLAYVEWARDLGHALAHGLTRYHAQRILPSAIVAMVAPHHVLDAFAMMNVVACTIAAVLWADLARVMRWSRAAAWAGFVGMFGSFAIAKHATYYPALTDPSAFALGMVMTWGYLTNRPVALVVAAVAGVVTWPALPPIALAMLIVPCGDAHGEQRRGVAVAAGVIAAIAFVAVGMYYLGHPVRGVGDEKFADWVSRPWLALTLPLLIAMIGAGLYFAVRPLGFYPLDRRRLAITIAISVAIYVARAIYFARVGTAGPGPTGAQFLCEHTLAALRGPLWGPVAHVVYFGPIVIVAMLAWPSIGRIAGAWGPAGVLGFAMIVMFAAGSNSRQWSHLVPLLVAGTVAATETWWTRGRLIAFAVITLAWSKVWFHIGYDTVDNWHRFPNQRYFMHTGPYIANGPFVIELVATLLTAALIWLIVRPPLPADRRREVDRVVAEPVADLVDGSASPIRGIEQR